MTIEERTNKLKAAEALITQVRESLSSEQKKCDCCGAVRFVDWNDKQMRDQLNGAIHRLQQVGRRINEPVEQLNDTDQ